MRLKGGLLQLLSKNAEKFDVAIRSLSETREMLLGLGGLFQNATDDMGMTTEELQGIGTLLISLSKRLSKAASTVELIGKANLQ